MCAHRPDHQAPPTDLPDLHRVLRERFGLERFRPGQEEVIRLLLQRRDVLVVMPTGAGKSLVFQFVSQLLPGLTVVVSPLISLMKDQVEAAADLGLAVGQINSAVSAAEREQALARAERGEIKLLYATPERFRNPHFIDRLRRIGVSLLAVDEAHCISEWGYDFRPAYLALKGAAERLGRPTLLALTATANPWVRRDTIERLGMRHCAVVVRGIDRPGLFLEVRGVLAEEEDHRVLRELLLEPPHGYPPELTETLRTAMDGPGIIYCRTTRAAEQTADWLREWRIPGDYYHGQRAPADRSRVQDAFMSGELRVIAATNAFGLGIDKRDIRFIIHRDVPASIEEYFQEAGRAGRDGKPARCTLIYRPADLGRAGFLAAGSTVSADDLQYLAAALRARPRTTITRLLERLNLGEGKVRRGLDLLAQRDIVETDGDQVELIVPEFDAGAISLGAEESRRAYEKSRIEMMRGYADTWECRRRYLLNYFGEELLETRCGWCDNDTRLDGRGEEPEVAEAVPYPVGSRVRHAVWGEGTVRTARPGEVSIAFDGVGEKTLALDAVRRRRLLSLVAESEPAPRPSGESRHFRIGERVLHPEYGEGQVVRETSDAVVVLFDHAGYHTLDRDRVLNEGLLTAVPLSA
jgi:ATP-dependent DNA helicase RecQ